MVSKYRVLKHFFLVRMPRVQGLTSSEAEEYRGVTIYFGDSIYLVVLQFLICLTLLTTCEFLEARVLYLSSSYSQHIAGYTVDS